MMGRMPEKLPRGELTLRRKTARMSTERFRRDFAGLSNEELLDKLFEVARDAVELSNEPLISLACTKFGSR